MAARPEPRLERWIGSARACGHEPEECSWLERNARLQVAVWGGPGLFDFASKR
ncbi:MAG: alpha-N-acetylglucosaminidase C-terminal domain-containing protein [Pseudomonadota bacterium]